MFVVAALAEAESAEEDEERQAGVQDHGLSWAGQGVVEVTGSFCHMCLFCHYDFKLTKGLPSMIAWFCKRRNIEDSAMLMLRFSADSKKH